MRAPRAFESNPSPISLAAVLLVALFFPSFYCVTLLRRRTFQEAVPRLGWSLPEPHATWGAFSLGPAAASDIRLRKKHIFFSEVLPEIVINYAGPPADNFCKAEVIPNLREFTKSSEKRINDLQKSTFPFICLQVAATMVKSPASSIPVEKTIKMASFFLADVPILQHESRRDKMLYTDRSLHFLP